MQAEDLRAALNILDGEKKLSALWCKEVGDEPPIDLLKALQERINQGEAESA